MSNSESHVPKDHPVLFSAIGYIGTFLLFAVIVAIAYLNNRPEPVDQATVEKRFATLADVTARQKAAISEYSVVDPTKGIVRIPVERAMEITLRELQQQQ